MPQDGDKRSLNVLSQRLSGRYIRAVESLKCLNLHPLQIFAQAPNIRSSFGFYTVAKVDITFRTYQGSYSFLDLIIAFKMRYTSTIILAILATSSSLVFSAPVPIAGTVDAPAYTVDKRGTVDAPAYTVDKRGTVDAPAYTVDKRGTVDAPAYTVDKREAVAGTVDAPAYTVDKRGTVDAPAYTVDKRGTVDAPAYTVDKRGTVDAPAYTVDKREAIAGTVDAPAYTVDKRGTVDAPAYTVDRREAVAGTVDAPAYTVDKRAINTPDFAIDVVPGISWIG